MKILLVGTGGYGSIYARALLNNTAPDIVWEGAVDPFFAAGRYDGEIKERGVPVYNTMEDFFAEHTADLAVIATPPFLHLEQCLCALRHGAYVLCEKPAAPSVDEVEQMIAAQKQYGRFIAVGYQWSFARAILALKQDILDGVLGKPLSFRTLISWPRDYAYYKRGGGWGGKLFVNGRPLYDSIASNACAHYIHNMLFLLGDTLASAATPTAIDAECLRANDIESFDTCTLRARAADTDLYFAASHAAESQINPAFVYTFENAEVRFAKDDTSQIVATFRDGSVKNYGDPFEEPAEKMFRCVEDIQTGKTPVCTAETAIAHTRLIAMLHESTELRTFPASLICETAEGDRRFVRGLTEALSEAYENCRLLSEVGFPQNA